MPAYNQPMSNHLQVIVAHVAESLDNAKKNGYFEPGQSLHGMDAFAIAIDLVEFDANCNDFDPSQLIKPVEAWMDRNSELFPQE